MRALPQSQSLNDSRVLLLLAAWPRRWVQQQAHESLEELWLEGVDDYKMYIHQLMADFPDIMRGGRNRRGDGEAPG
jgi:hypothetical protein